jgi:hypothetical protein
VPRRPLQGLLAVEVGVDTHAGVLGQLCLPFVIVRLLEGSKSEAALPKGLFWSRGRTPDERVSVLRPRLPTSRVTRDLARDLARRLTAPPEGPPSQGASSAARSGGRADSTRKPATKASPAHAT